MRLWTLCFGLNLDQESFIIESKEISVFYTTVRRQLFLIFFYSYKKTDNIQQRLQYIIFYTVFDELLEYFKKYFDYCCRHYFQIYFEWVLNICFKTYYPINPGTDRIVGMSFDWNKLNTDNFKKMIKAFQLYLLSKSSKYVFEHARHVSVFNCPIDILNSN